MNRSLIALMPPPSQEGPDARQRERMRGGPSGQNARRERSDSSLVPALEALETGVYVRARACVRACTSVSE